MATLQLNLGLPSVRPARPFVKWAGGKSKLVPKLLELTPKTFERYFEPFLGGGAFFFALSPKIAILNDLNADLVHTYETVRDNPEALFNALGEMKVTADEFYRLRALDSNSLDKVERAARFIYLNKTCFNGLYRVNKEGKFNTPFGNYSSVALADIDNLRAVSQALSGASLMSDSFKTVLAEAKEGDFVYLDPPYVPVGEYSDFKRYTAEQFGETGQVDLAILFRKLDERGCFLLLSNSDNPIVHDLYKGYRFESVEMPRFVNCKGDRRGKVTELLVRNYV